MATMKWSAAALAMMVGACSVHDDNQQAAASATPAVETSGVVREEVQATPAPVIAPTQPVLQSQPGPKGSQIALNKVAVTGDIMTVSMTVQGGSLGYEYVKVDEVSAIDDATSQRISVLKDNAGNWMAAPLGSDGKELRLEPSGPQVVWMKFPAPPPTTKTVSITLPGAAPFDAVPVAR